MTKKKETPPKFKCPDCVAEYPTARGLSSHRRAAHGYVSQNKYAIAARSIVKVKPEPAPATNPLACDQCDFVAKNVSALTWHKARNHSAPTLLHCDLCDFVAKWPGGLSLHKRKTHKDVFAPERTSKTTRREIAHTKEIQTITVRPASNGHNPSTEAHAAPDGISEVTLALALGRVQELCRSFAVEHDLPPKLFASRLAGLIYATTLR